MGTDVQTLTLPAQLIETARRVKYRWPDSNERLFGQYSEQWALMANMCWNLHDRPNSQVMSALQKNEGEFIEAFDDFWNRRVRDNSRSAYAASSEIALRLGEAGTVLAAEKNTALQVLGKVHEFLNRPTLRLPLLGLSLDDQNARAAADDQVISWAQQTLADTRQNTKTRLNRITSQLDEAQRKLGEGTGALVADRKKLEAAVG